MTKCLACGYDMAKVTAKFRENVCSRSCYFILCRKKK